MGLAGELATEAALTGWAPGAAAKAAHICFLAWLTERGTNGAREDAQAVAQLRAFILKNGSARFDVWLDAPPAEAAQVDTETPPPFEKFRIQHRAGWRRWEQALENGRSGWRYFLTAEGLNEALAGLASREARRTLAGLGYIVPPDGGADAERGNLSKVYKYRAIRTYASTNIGAGLLASVDGAD